MGINRLALLAVGLAGLVPAASFADNLTPATAAQYTVGQGWTTLSSDLVGRFYKFGVVPGRSYCAETALADLNTDSADTEIFILSTTLTTVVANDNNTAEPSDASGPGTSRACWIAAPGQTDQYLEVVDNVGAGIPRRFRISDTSLWAPWFFTGNGFEAFILIKNTTNQSLSVAVSLYDTDGNPIGAVSGGLILANGSRNLQLSTPPFALMSGSGTVQISHNGAPGALVAGVTSLSFGTGVSFDVQASPRQDYRR